MLQLPLLGFFLIGVPESFLLVFVSYLFAGKRINKKLYFISSISFIIIAWLVRKFPIHFGVHTIIIILMYNIINILINKISINESVCSILIGMIVILICEWVNLFILDNFLRVNVEKIIKNPFMKNLYMMPSLILFACFVLGLYEFVYKNKRRSIKKCL